MRSETPRNPAVPEPGHYLMRLVRKGPHVPARIIFENGVWSAVIDGKQEGPPATDPIHAKGVFRIWPYAPRTTAEDYERRLKLAAWARVHAPDHPAANPRKPIDLTTAPPLWSDDMVLNLKATSADLDLPEFDDEPARGPAPPAGIGHNSGETGRAKAATAAAPAPGPASFDELLDPEALRLALEMEHGPLIQRRDVLLKQLEKWKNDMAPGILTEEAAAAATDFGAQLKQQSKKTDTTRELVKKPFMAANNTVQAFFKSIIDSLDLGVKDIETKLTAYSRKKAEEARKAAEEEAKTKREEAARLAKAAETSGSVDVLETASTAATNADRAERAAAAPVANFSRSRGSFGGVSSASIRYAYKVEDLSKVPLEYLMVDDSKVRAAINGKNRVAEIAGLTISEDFQSKIRG